MQLRAIHLPAFLLLLAQPSYGKGWFSFFSSDHSSENRESECGLRLKANKPKRSIRYQENEDLIQKIISQYKNHSGSSQIVVDLSRIENLDYFETIFENRLDHAGFRVIDFKLDAASTLEERWQSIRDRLNHKYSDQSRNWSIDGTPGMSGTNFLRQVIRSGGISQDRPLVLYFKSYTSHSNEKDAISLWLESLNEQLAGLTYRTHGLVHVVISTPNEIYQLGSKGFQGAYRVVVE